jgi:hypothetical protein
LAGIWIKGTSVLFFDGNALIYELFGQVATLADKNHHLTDFLFTFVSLSHSFAA